MSDHTVTGYNHESEIRRAMRIIQDAYSQIDDLKDFKSNVNSNQYGSASDINFSYKYGGDSIGKWSKNLHIESCLGEKAVTAITLVLEAFYKNLIQAETDRLRSLLIEGE